MSSMITNCIEKGEVFRIFAAELNKIGMHFQNLLSPLLKVPTEDVVAKFTSLMKAKY